MTNEGWPKIALRPRNAEHLDEASRRLMMARLPRERVREDERLAGKVIDPGTPFARTLARFESALAQDTVHNECLFRAQINEWLADDLTGDVRRDLTALNRRVYMELFLTPVSDAWLGMVPDDTYTALEKDGCACEPGAPPMQAAVAGDPAK